MTGDARPDRPASAGTGRGRPLGEGELVIAVDAKERRYLLRLAPGKQLHLHTGTVGHDALIGSPEGLAVQTSGGARIVVVRPTLADYILKMPRGAQIIYPKDLAQIIVSADVGPGQRVLEAGMGSGALSLAVLRAIGGAGHLVSYELRDDHAARAVKNIEEWLGERPANHEVRIADVCEEAVEPGYDRVLLDLPDPPKAMEGILGRMLPGAILLAYLPTVPQVSETVEAMRDAGLGLIETTETLVRPWHVDGLSVRPDHRMVAHTGFLVAGRLLGAR